MIPIRNRKKTLEVTVEEMRNFAFTYVENTPLLNNNLRTYLIERNILKLLYQM